MRPVRVLLPLALALAGCGSDVRAPDEHAPTVETGVRLLTDRQYAATVRDLFPGVLVPELHTPGTHPNQFVHEEVIAVDAALLVQYRIAAQEIGRQLSPTDVLGCGVDHDCAHSSLAMLASRAFRRPLEDGEAEQLARIYDEGGTGLAIEAILQAPAFLYRTDLGDEIGDHVALTSFEVASNVSFLLLGSIPDDALWKRALDRSILDEDVLAREVDRLLETPRVRAQIDQAVLDWLQIDRVLAAEKDEALFPDIDADLRASMHEETATFVHDVMWRRGGSLHELLTSRETFVDERLAAHYGITDVAGDEPVAVAAPRHRSGVLTHASVLTFLATTRSESIIQRGLYVNRVLLCTPELGRPPFASISEVSGLTSQLSESQFGHYRMANAFCKGCHQSIDPPGWALNHFDGAGRYRDTDASSIPVESDTTILVDGTPHAIADAAQLANVLAHSRQVARCIVDQFARHAFGRHPGWEAIREARAAFEENADLTELFRALALSPAFRERRSGS